MGHVAGVLVGWWSTNQPLHYYRHKHQCYACFRQPIGLSNQYRHSMKQFWCFGVLIYHYYTQSNPSTDNDGMHSTSVIVCDQAALVDWILSLIITPRLQHIHQLSIGIGFASNTLHILSRVSLLQESKFVYYCPDSTHDVPSITWMPFEYTPPQSILMEYIPIGIVGGCYSSYYCINKNHLRHYTAGGADVRISRESCHQWVNSKPFWTQPLHPFHHIS